jgi:energy-converting hydrogenase A subunit R
MICFDLEGPLSPQDNAYEVMGLVDEGHRIFEVISRYDDLVALEGRKGYEPGDTLALIAPFLVYHNISEGDIRKVSEMAYLVDGTKELVSWLKARNWHTRIISTSYEQHALNIGSKLGVPSNDTACTKFPLDSYREKFGSEDFSLISDIEPNILELSETMDDDKIKPLLDGFFFRDLPKTRLGEVMNDMSVCGGQRKVKALIRFAENASVSVSDIVAVGDSITDFKMLGYLHENGGVAIAFNANQYAIPYATIGIATTDMSHLSQVLVAWEEGGRDTVVETVRGLEIGQDTWPYFNVLYEKKEHDEVLEIHKKARSIVRGKAAKLG